MQATTKEVWQYLGKDSFTKVRAEAVGTGDGTTSTWELDHDNVIAGTLTLYTDGTAVGTASYSVDLDDGVITLTASSGSAITADYDYADIEDSVVGSFLTQSSKLVERLTERTFSTGSTTEYLDVEKGQSVFFVSNYPVTTLSSVQANTASSIGDAPAWSTSTEGIGNDYIANSDDLRIGRFEYIDNFPIPGKDRLKVTYSYGYTSSDDLSLVKELEILLATRAMINSAVYKAIFKGQDNFTPVRLEEINRRIEELKNVLKKVNIDKI